jgi:hypothetical protein
MEDLAQQLGEILATARDSGMVLPYYMVAVAHNGSMIFIKYEEDQAGYGLKAEQLADYINDDGFMIPINMMLVDKTGQAVRVFIGQEGKPKFLH